MRTRILILTTSLAALLTAACVNPAYEPDGGNSAARFPADRGLVLLSVGGGPVEAQAGVSRTVLPGGGGAADYGYMLFATSEDLEGEDFSLPVGGGEFQLELKPARWTLTVKAWEGAVPDNPNAAGAPAPAFSGGASLEVTAGGVFPIAVPLMPAGGTGTFSYTIDFPYFSYGDGTEYPANLSYGLLNVYPLEGGDAVKVIDLWHGIAADEAGTGKKAAGMVTLPAGWYRIAFDLSCDYKPARLYAAKSEVLIVYADRDSAYTDAFVAADFSPIVPVAKGMAGTGARVFSADEIWGIGLKCLEGFLAYKPLNDSDGPYRIAITGDLGSMGNAEDRLIDLFNVLQGRYVAYDLSACTGTEIADVTAAAVNRRMNRDRVVTVLLPETVTKIGAYAFYDCSSLSYINLPPKLESIGKAAFSGRLNVVGGGVKGPKLASITLPATIKSIGEDAFVFCSRLERLDMSAAEDLTEIQYGTFQDCSSLTEIILPPQLTSIGDYAFYGGGGAAAVILPDTLVSTGAGFFNGFSNLEELDIPAGVGALGDSALQFTTSLRSLTLRKNDGVVTLSTYALGGTGLITIPGSAVYVPQAQLDAYKTAADEAGAWKTLNDKWRQVQNKDAAEYIFRAIE
jgi:hypothetical protein